MKRYITWDPYAEGVGSVTGIYVGAFPETITGGMESESPTPEYSQFPSMRATLRINTETGELYYDYEKETNVETRVSELEETNAQLNEELGTLIMQSALDKATITDLNETLGGLMLEVAALKGGAE